MQSFIQNVTMTLCQYMQSLAAYRVRDALKWTGIYMTIGLILSVFLGFPTTFAVLILIIITCSIVFGCKEVLVIKARTIKSPSSTGIRYVCMKCGKKYGITACPNCGSKAKKVEF